MLVRQNAERVAINTPVQGTSADMIKRAMISIHKELLGATFKTKMILQVHDELIFDGPENEVDKITPIIKMPVTSTFPITRMDGKAHSTIIVTLRTGIPRTRTLLM